MCVLKGPIPKVAAGAGANTPVTYIVADGDEVHGPDRALRLQSALIVSTPDANCTRVSDISFVC